MSLRGQPSAAPNVLSSMATKRHGFVGHVSGRFLSALPSMKQPDVPEAGGGGGTWLGSISSHSFLGSNLARHCLWPPGSRQQPGTHPRGTDCRVLFRQSPRGGSGRTGFHEALPPSLRRSALCRDGWSPDGQAGTAGRLLRNSLPPPSSFGGKISSCLGPDPTLWGHSPPSDPTEQKGA